ncbi:MAG: hypothetical protein IKS83_06485 [Victivallales bacterium]|nr:hypothetical protein [Victivallales bacterium]
MNTSGELLLLGIGTAGSRAAYYIYQRGGLPGLRILAVDSGDAIQEIPAALPSAQLPLPPKVPVGEAAREANESLNAIIDAHLRGARMLFIVTCLGGNTGAYYTQAALLYAKLHNLPAAALVAMPHDFDNDECKWTADSALDTLRAQHFKVLSLDCQAFGHLFPDQSREAAYPQAVRWIAETTLGYLKLFTLQENPRGERPNTAFAGRSRPNVPMDDLPRGIFTNVPATFFNGENLDLPTFWRQHSKQ